MIMSLIFFKPLNQNVSGGHNMKKIVAQLFVIGITVMTFAAPLLAAGGCGP